MENSILLYCCLLIGLTNGLVVVQQQQHQPYYLVNYNPQIVPWLSKMPISTYGLFDVDIPRIVSEYIFSKFSLVYQGLRLFLDKVFFRWCWGCRENRF